MLVHLQEQPLCPLVVVGRARIHLLQGGGVAKVTTLINCMLNERTSLSIQFEQHKDEDYMTQLTSYPGHIGGANMPNVVWVQDYPTWSGYKTIYTIAIPYPMPIKLTADTQQLQLHVGNVAV